MSELAARGTGPGGVLAAAVAAVGPADEAAVAAAWQRQAVLTKPPGSLGELEALGVQLAGLAGVCPPPVPVAPAVAVFAGDHGVHARGVSPWPQEVTGQMVANFEAGGAVINAFARQVGAFVTVVDIGTVGGSGARHVRAGTDDFTAGPALTRAEAVTALEHGIAVAHELVDGGADLLITGDMGIANTTPAAALIAVFAGAEPVAVTGRGTGIDDETLARKISVVAAGIARHEPDPADPVGVLAAFGGLEHAGLAGFILGGAARRVPVVIDGVNAGAAALAAASFAPDVRAALVAGHRSAEPGATVALAALGLTPLIDLGLRLGEGTGAALAFPIVAGAARVLGEVATFDSAGVSEK